MYIYIYIYTHTRTHTHKSIPVPTGWNGRCETIPVLHGTMSVLKFPFSSLFFCQSFALPAVTRYLWRWPPPWVRGLCGGCAWSRGTSQKTQQGFVHTRDSTGLGTPKLGALSRAPVKIAQSRDLPTVLVFFLFCGVRFTRCSFFGRRLGDDEDGGGAGGADGDGIKPVHDGGNDICWQVLCCSKAAPGRWRVVFGRALSRRCKAHGLLCGEEG